MCCIQRWLQANSHPSSLGTGKLIVQISRLCSLPAKVTLLKNIYTSTAQKQMINYNAFSNDKTNKSVQDAEIHNRLYY